MPVLKFYNVFSNGKFVKRFTSFTAARKFVFLRSGTDLFGNVCNYDIINADTGELVPLCP